jgi:hypothetical protein
MARFVVPSEAWLSVRYVRRARRTGENIIGGVSFSFFFILHAVACIATVQAIACIVNQCLLLYSALDKAALEKYHDDSSI